MLAQRMIGPARLACRCYATNNSTTPPLLLKIRNDLKTAMREKDTNRLSVLRALLAETMNASKTNTPVHTDLQMLALLRKTKKANKAASDEFRGAGRDDLAEREDNQSRILDEYASCVSVVDEDEITSTVTRIVHSMESEGAKISLGEVLRRVLSPEELGLKPVEKAQVASIVKQALAAP